MIVVTSPTGLIGHQVALNLLQHSEPIRIIVRDPSRLAATVRDRVDIVQGSHGERAVVDQAFEGVDTVFWLVLSGNLDDLKQRHRALRLSYDAAPTAQMLAALQRLPGVTALEQDGRSLRLSVQGDVQALMQRIRLQDDAPGNLEPLDQNLEDLFHSLMQDAP